MAEMMTDGPDKASTRVKRERPEGGIPGLLRTIALIAVAAGTLGSEILVIRTGGRSQPLLTVIFVVWILLPFAALAWANVVSKGWPVLTRMALYFTTYIISLGAPAFYGGVILPSAGSPRAFVFVMGPLASWALMAIVVPIAGVISRRRS